MSMRLFELMLWAAGNTLLLSAVSIVIGLALGLVICAGRLSRARFCAGRRSPSSPFFGAFRCWCSSS